PPLTETAPVSDVHVPKVPGYGLPALPLRAVPGKAAGFPDAAAIAGPDIGPSLSSPARCGLADSARRQRPAPAQPPRWLPARSHWLAAAAADLRLVFYSKR